MDHDRVSKDAAGPEAPAPASSERPAEAAIRSRDAHPMARILHGMYEFIALLAVDGTTQYLNRAALDAAGFLERDPIGLAFWEGLSPIILP